jgi:hypothetical protein
MPTIDPTIYERIDELILELKTKGEIAQPAVRILLENRNQWIAEVAELENSQGHSVVEEAKSQQRYAIIRDLGKTRTSKQIETMIRDYRNGDWKSDRNKAKNPYPASDYRNSLFTILRYRDRAIGDRRIRYILKTKGV